MESFPEQQENSEERVLKMAALTDDFEGYIHPHAPRIATLADAVAQKFNMASHDRFSLRHASLVHDIGEVVMNRDYIKSVRILKDEERIDMERHPVIGEQEASKRGLNRAIQLLVRWHHEWWNGMGYPDGLEGEQIPLAARILRLADTYCALTDSRPFNSPLTEAEAKQYVAEWAGIEFDPKVVKAFLELEDLKELESFANR
jgi:HD-GYP domain-containing protein (c-di-GMP phosphodiesterase class II)